jgi:hypothetical protein
MATKVTVCPGVEGLGLEVSAVAVPALPTDCDTAEETLAAKFSVPAYSAVMLWTPADNAVVAKVACPEPFNTPDPKVAAPSLKVTVPIEMPDPAGGVTVAVNVTVWPQIEGFSEEVSVVEVAAFAEPGVVLRIIVRLLLP